MNKRIIHYFALAIISIIVVIPSSFLSSQPLDSLWMYSYGQDTVYEKGYDIVQKSDSGYLVVGRKEITNPVFNPFIISIDKYGELLWDKNFSSSGWDAFFDIIATSDGNFLIGGSYNDLAWLVKMNESGDTLWSKTYGDDFGAIKSIQELPNNDIIITGRTVNYNYNFYLLKINQSGDSIWSHKYIFNSSYGQQWYDNSRCVRQTLDEGYILTTGGVGGYGNIFSIIVKTDSNGDTLWSINEIDSISLTHMFLSDILIDHDTVYILGSSGFSNLEGSIVIIKMNSDGEVYWIKGYNDLYGSSFRGYYGMFTTNNTIYIAGSPHNYEQMIYVFEIDKNGDLIWGKYYGEYEKTNLVTSIISSFTEKLVLAGYDHPMYDVFVFELGENPSQILPTNNLNDFDFSIFPNPSKSFTNIEFYVPNKALTRVTIYSLSGKELEVLENNTLTKGEYGLQWNTSTVPNGIYICKIEMNKQIQVKKIVVSR